MKINRNLIALTSLVACAFAVAPSWSEEVSKAQTDEAAQTEAASTQEAPIEVATLPTAVIDGKQVTLLAQQPESSKKVSFRKYRAENTLHFKQADSLYGKSIRLSIGLGAPFAY